MEGFFKLISYYQTQSEPAYCGLATLSMVLNALSIDPGRKWKGILSDSITSFFFFFCPGESGSRFFGFCSVDNVSDAKRKRP